MQLKEYSFRIDIRKKREIEYIEVVQGDTGTNVFNITLLDGDNPYNLYNLHVEIIFKKSDGTTVEQNDIEKVNDVQGKIRCVLKTNTIAFPGKVIAELKILDNDKMLTSTTFEFWVRKSLLDDDTIESTNEFPILTQLINETHDLIETVRQIEEQVPENVVVKLNQLEETTNGLITAFGEKIDKSSIANNTITTVAGLVLDARQGKALQDQINATNNNLGGQKIRSGAALLTFNASGWAQLDISSLAYTQMPVVFAQMVNAVSVAVIIGCNPVDKNTVNIGARTVSSGAAFTGTEWVRYFIVGY